MIEMENSPIDVTELGIVMSFNEEPDSNAKFSIGVTELGVVMSFNEEYCQMR